LEIVKAFGDDFRLVGIGVSAIGRVFATAPSSNVRSRFSMIEVNSKTAAVTPYPDADSLIGGSDRPLRVKDIHGRIPDLCS
jgi:hypothetical protein